LILAAGAFAGWQIGTRDISDERVFRKPERSWDASKLAEKPPKQQREHWSGELGRLCANFDFFFKHDMANGAFRPARCSLSGRDETVLFAYGFDTAQTQQAWVSEWGNLAAQRGATLVEEETWAVEVLDASIV
jgi:hypothetical protein